MTAVRVTYPYGRHSLKKIGDHVSQVPLQRVIVNGQRYVVMGTPSQVARRKVSRENRQEYDNHKRALELERKMPCGHKDAKAVAISKMMQIPESHAKKLLDKKHSKNVVLDGKID